MTAGLILAAGESNRMGSMKPLLEINGKTFLVHMIEVLREGGADPVVVVLGHNADIIIKEIPPGAATVVVNSDYKEGQLKSIQCGIKSPALASADGVLITPVDIPLISPELVQQIISTASVSDKGIIIPVFRDRRGHPGYFSKRLFPELLNAPLNSGARWVIHAHPEEIHEMPTDEEGIIRNINTPENYSEYIEKR